MQDLTKYSCQMALPGFDVAAQQKLAGAKVLVVGAGGLGCPVLQYLVSSGVGMVGIAEYDIISVKNLHRQVLYTPADEGKKKAIVAKEKLQAQNPDVRIVLHDVQVANDNVQELIFDYDIVADCTDNFETRYLLNDACVLAKKPLVYGAIYQYEGQVAIWNVRNNDGMYSPNYRDVYPDVNAAAIPNCADGGVIPTIAGIIGCTQANEVLKYITGNGELLAGRLLIFDALNMQSRVIKIGTVTKTEITQLPGVNVAEEITQQELEAEQDKYQLIDVREADEREAFHIGGLHLPLAEINTIDINPGKPLVCYCASGRRSKEAAKILQQRFPGLLVFSLQGGLNNWKVTH